LFSFAAKDVCDDVFAHWAQADFGELVFLCDEVVGDAREGEEQGDDDAGAVAAEFAVQDDGVCGVVFEVEEDCAEGAAGVVQDFAVAVACALDVGVSVFVR